MGVDESNISTELSLKDFNVYVGFFKVNKNFYNKLNLILPTTLPVFKKNFFLNLEGRVRKSVKLPDTFKLVLGDLDIIRVFYDLLKNSIIHNFSFLFSFNKVLDFFFNIVDYSCKFLFSSKFLFNRLYFYNGFQNNEVVS